MSIREVFGAACRAGRVSLDLTQQQLADAVGIHRGYLANIEAGRANVSVDQIDRIAQVLGQRLELIVHAPAFVATRRNHDTVHAWCSGYVARRLTAASWLVAREVDVSADGVRGWIDLFAFHPSSQTLVVIELKTRIDDLGGAERQLGWYERHAIRAANRLGWRPSRVLVWLILLATDEVEAVLLAARDLISQTFPGRADEMLEVVAGGSGAGHRSVALVDPAGRRARWLIRTRLDGRRSPARYRNYGDAARRIPRRRSSG
jgi:transcriptional regulator with XRE-family HTH domain